MILFLFDGLVYHNQRHQKVIVPESPLITTQKIAIDDIHIQILRWTRRLIHMKYIARMSETIFMCST